MNFTLESRSCCVSLRRAIHASSPSLNSIWSKPAISFIPKCFRAERSMKMSMMQETISVWLLGSHRFSFYKMQTISSMIGNLRSSAIPASLAFSYMFSAIFSLSMYFDAYCMMLLWLRPVICISSSNFFRVSSLIRSPSLEVRIRKQFPIVSSMAVSMSSFVPFLYSS